MTHHPIFLTGVIEQMAAAEIMLSKCDPNMSRTFPEIQSFTVTVNPRTWELSLLQPEQGVGSGDSNDAGAVASASYPRTDEQVKEIHTGEAVAVADGKTGKQGARKRKQDFITKYENGLTQPKKKLYELSPDVAESHGFSPKKVTKAIRSKQYRVQKNTQLAEANNEILRLREKYQQLEANYKNLQDELAIEKTKRKELEARHGLGQPIYNTEVTEDVSAGFVETFNDSLFDGRLLPEEEEPEMYLQKIMQ